MKFLLLMAEADHFARWEAADDALRERVVADFWAFDAAVKQRGAIVGGEALSPSSAARTVQPGPDRLVTDGPFVETVEQLGGFYLIEVDTQAIALELAALLPREYCVEVRECVDVSF